ncbi:MAG: electron transport complex subunit RsxC [Zoogloeaceae bacterium]|jgi:electron transport complex protein RnfC|nr:electron transport complex subunit RsxC [Zoogloeaceae bacterium]
MLRPLFSFPGGIKPDSHKDDSSRTPIAPAPLPERLTLPLRQSAGVMPLPTVRVGDRVKKGQVIASADKWVSASLHAPTSGKVADIGKYPMAHPSGLPALAIVIESDGLDEWRERQPLDWQRLAPQAVRQYLQQSGVVGLGGALFPSHVKLDTETRIEELIINGAECEPYITCDDRLMRERAAEIVSGVALLRDFTGARQTLIAIENNKPEAIRAMRGAISEHGENFAVVTLPTRYPAGSLRQLVYTLTGKRAPSNVLPTAMGVQCFNVATAHSIWRAIVLGEPVVRRVVTVSGNVRAPGNWDAPIGMSMTALLELSGTFPDTDGLIAGGPMMGLPLPLATGAPLTKDSNCLIARSPRLFPPRPPESPCIRCTACAQVCPQGLQPFELYWWSRARNFEKAADYALAECIECGCCAYVCPASIPLVHYFRFAKGELAAAAREQKMADSARFRFEFRQFRIEREKAEKAEKLARAAAAQAAKQKSAAAVEAPAASGEPAPMASLKSHDQPCAPNPEPR